MKNKGFTLVEILGTIVIITAIALITTPVILHMIEQSQKKVFETNINGYMETARLDNSKKGYIASFYNIENGKILDEEGNALKKNGGYVENGTVSITEEGDIFLAIHNNKWCALKSIEEEKIAVTEYINGKCTIGEPQKVEEKCFILNEKNASEIIGYTCAHKAIIIPDAINGVEIKSIGENAFRGKNLINVTLPEKLESIKSFAFSNNQLTDITIPNSVTTIGYAPFTNNKLPDEKAFIYKRNKDGTEDKTLLISYGGAKKENVAIPNNVTRIGNYAFEGVGLININIPSTVTRIDTSAFQNNKLTSISIPSSITSLGRFVFADNQLTSINLPNPSITWPGGIFNNNKLPDNQAFIYYESDGSTILTSYGGAKKENVTIPSHITAVGSYAFNSVGLISINIPNTITNIGVRAFNNNKLPDDQAFIYQRNEDGTEDKTMLISYGGKKRENVIIPSSVITIGSGAFSEIQLKSVTIPDSVTSIYKTVFADNQLTSITIPSSVTHIETSAFRNNSDNMKVIVNKPEGSITGSPWGASSVEWTG